MIMRIFDTILFCNELALLQTRLHELSEVVDQFVVVEAPITFSGREKPLYFADHQDQFAEFVDRIIHVIVPDLPVGISPFRAKIRKILQRDAVVRGLMNAADKDVVMLSDADEIPSAASIKQCVDAIRFSRGAVLRMEEYRYGFYYEADYECPPRTVATTFKDLLTFTPTVLKEGGKNHGFSVIENGGWHLSCFLDGRGLQYKADSCAEEHMIGTPIEKLESARRIGIDVFGADSRLKQVDPHKQVVPRFIEEHQDGLFGPFYIHPDQEALTENEEALVEQTYRSVMS